MMAEVIKALEMAEHGKRRKVAEQYAKALGISVATLYRRLEENGWSNRKKRSDSGKSKVDDDTLGILSSYIKSGIRSNDKATIGIPVARQVLEYEGYDFKDADNSTLSRLLRDKAMDLTTQQNPTPHIHMRSLHPNHVHEVDPSLCLMYYLPRGGQRILEEREVYKNKPFLEGKKAKLKVWRYVMVDHYSGSICHRYYNVAGENTLTLWEFLMYSWSIKENPLFVFHGLPKMMIWDKGSANTSKAISNALKGLNVETYAHEVGAPRTKGAVENANFIIQQAFESRLRSQPVKNIDELNQRAAQFDALYNANLIKNYDSSLKRGHMNLVRNDLWLRITDEQLRDLPEGANSLLYKDGETRIVAGDLCISFVHPRVGHSSYYSLGRLPGIRVKMQVNVQPILTDEEGAIRVKYDFNGQEIIDEVYPELLDEAGFRLSAAVWGEEFKSLPDTVVEKVGKTLDGIIGDKKHPFKDMNEGEGIRSLDSIENEDENSLILHRFGTKSNNPTPRIRVSIIEAAKRLSMMMGWWDPWCLKYLKENYKDGVPEADLSDIEILLEEERATKECTVG